MALPRVVAALQPWAEISQRLRRYRPEISESLRRNFKTDSLAAEEQPADLVCQIVIAHDVNLSLIEGSNAVESAVD